MRLVAFWRSSWTGLLEQVEASPSMMAAVPARAADGQIRLDHLQHSVV